MQVCLKTNDLNDYRMFLKIKEEPCESRSNGTRRR